ncbi:unnamed protein product [Rotaria magnacalcarata]|uniref:Uncharacterized protein n=4 Tax=Rotaria magnacalcarata TaxID=392030 RepID=A0A819XGU9_9BILA|nr:unnamed protein product [Rotaria magnacalcarata]CAF4174293.1 unnamed protein product [Rotaria magnacalcarata]
MLSEDRSASTADALARWFQSFQSADIFIDGDNLHCLTSNSNLQDIWQKMIRHCHPADYVKKVKESIRIAELKERYPDSWEQHKNAQIQQGQIEQRIGLRLREIYSARSEQSTNIFNELNRVQTMINDEHNLISSLDKQLQIYRQLANYLNQLALMKEQLNLLTSVNGINHQVAELMNLNISLTEKFQQSINLNDLCSLMNTLIQQRINQLSKIEKDDQERNSSIMDNYEEALTKANLDFTKQFVHLANIRMECAKLHSRLADSKREVLSRRPSNEQTQLLSILDAMIASKSVEVHLSLLKTKIQTEIEQNKKSDEKSIPRIHQQIIEKRNELNRIDNQLNKIIQENPLEKLEKLELKIRDYTRLINDLPTRFHSLNIMHLSLSNDLRSNILTWPIEQFSRINLINNPIEITIESPPTPLVMIPSQTPTTPLTSLKQLLGIRTQDTLILEPPITTNMPIIEENQSWDMDINEDETLSIKYPSISFIDWDLLTRVDNQMEEALKQCQQDFNQYEQFFQNIIKEIDRVDPLPTLNNSLTNISIPFENLRQQYHDEILTTSLLESVFTSFHRKRTVKTQSNQDISHFIIRSSLRSSSSTINAVLELEHSPSIISLNQLHYSSSLSSAMTISNSNDIKRYHPGEQIQFSPIKIERQALHSSNKQIEIITC